MGRIAFPIMGGYVLFFAAGFLGVTVLWIGDHFPRLGKVTAPGVLYLAFLTVAFTVIGLGLIGLRKWAALVFSALTVFIAFWAFKDALRPNQSPEDWPWVGYVIGLLLIAPAILTATNWRVLVWRHPRNRGAL